MSGRLEFDVTFGRPKQPREDQTPLRLLLIGDFSGAPVAERPPLATRPTHQLDTDSISAVMQRLSTRVSVADSTLELRELDDFHPDRLISRIEVLEALVEKRHRPPERDETFAQLLGGEAVAAPAPPPSPGTALDALIRKVVAPHIVKPDPDARAYQQAIDAGLTDQMRAVLHQPAFQASEAAWRGVQWLTSSLELDEHLQLHLFDVSRDELLTDIIAARGRLTQTGTYRALVDRWRNVPGADGWSALVTLLQFGPSDTDIGLLAALGLIASEAGGPLLGSADRSLLNANSDHSSAWSQLRRSEAARWIGLAAPRVLLRPPYGSRGEPVEKFAFEELPAEPAHEHFLWGSASLALALLIGRAFTARAWDMELGDARDLDDLPAYIIERDGEPELVPAAEEFLSESRLQALLDAGIMPIASRRDRHAAVVIRFQSIAHPPAALAW
jgi:type VI secretion system protein ImpC